ncbi:hypothetical protein GCM10011414_06240 [Croceivirga lutea]|uniref:S8 family serine peptidase n=1 Tax=Croceivirga lutea TaxID=1775167 RepID=UPI0019C526C3|nr:S8 family serine peptidase [Croceivirga lutea]GGG39576.1 hypothetical protein GCM10011414_06240 [Croceivirga lutea]
MTIAFVHKMLFKNVHNSLLGILFAFTCIVSAQSNAVEHTTSYNAEVLNQLKTEFKLEQNKIDKKINSYLLDKQIPKFQKASNGNTISVLDFDAAGEPIFYTTLVSISSINTRANHLYWNGSLDLGISGENMTMGIWDAGSALASHQEFSTRISTSEIDIEVDNHATMVTGIISATGINEKAKGVAYDAEVLSFDWTNDKTEVIDAALDGLLVSNHSYGIKTSNVPDWYFGAYLPISRAWDKIMYNAPYYLMVSAAGNAQQSKHNQEPISGKSEDGFDLLVGFTTAKNGLVVTSAQAELDDNGNLISAKTTSYSSYGPTDDGRIKPDLAGDGAAVYTTTSTNNSSYGTSIGTSMATPGVSASLLLLQQYYEQLFGSFMKAATLKGLALHTADDVLAPGPDYKLGWGVLNTKKAAQFLQRVDYSTFLIEERLGEENTYSITVEAKGNQPLTASLSWTDVEGELQESGKANDYKSRLVNDLDVRITKDGETFYPWKLNPSKANLPAFKGDNTVDPYERINIENPEGFYTITVTYKGELTNALQDFSLLVSGIKNSNCNIDVPTDFKIAAVTDNGGTLLWNKSDETLYEVQYKAEDDELWAVQALFDNRFELLGLQKGVRYKARVRSVCSENLVSEFSEEISFVFDGGATQIGDATQWEKMQLVLYPNPVESELMIATERSRNTYYQVLDQAGFIIKQGRFQGSVKVSDLASGVYFISIHDEGKTKTKKFIKH